MAVIYGSNVNVKSTNKCFATITDGTNDGSENYLCMQRYVISDPHTGIFVTGFLDEDCMTEYMGSTCNM